MDVDIDFPDRDIILNKLQHRVALLESGKKHNTGIYATEIPHNPITNIATIPHKQAEKRGYFKLDFLNVSIYQKIRDEEHLIQLMAEEPIWNLLQEEQFVNQLFHLNGHCNLLKKVRPTSVVQLAAVLAMIRPSKRYLQDEDWNTIMGAVWTKPIDGAYYYKQAHAISYAMAVVVHMNLLCEEIIKNN